MKVSYENEGGSVYTSILAHYSDSEGSDQLETLTLYGVESAAYGSAESGLFGCGVGHILVGQTGIGAGCCAAATGPVSTQNRQISVRGAAQRALNRTTPSTTSRVHVQSA